MLRSGLCCTHDKQPGNDGDNFLHVAALLSNHDLLRCYQSHQHRDINSRLISF